MRQFAPLTGSLCGLLLFLLSFATLISAQDSSIPSGWENTASNRTRTERQSIAWEAAEELVNNVHSAAGLPPDAPSDVSGRINTVSNMVIVLASQDWRNGNSSWKHPYIDNVLQSYESGQSDLSDTSDNESNALFGLAEIAAYLAYNDSASLETAKNKFDIIHTDFLSASAAKSGAYPRAFTTTCGEKLGGVVFSAHGDVNDLAVHASMIGPWIVLAARLYDLTRNSTYLDAAQQSIQFMSMNLVTQSGAHTFVDGSIYNVTSCQINDGGSFHGDDLGTYIEGLSIMANITLASGNDTYTQMLYNLIPAIVTLSQLHTSDGILTPTTSYVTKGYLIRGLLEARLRSPSNDSLIALIDSYLTIQFNAVLTNAAIGDSDYKIAWTPGANVPINYNTVGSIDALNVFNAASVIALDRSASPASPTSTLSTVTTPTSIDSTSPGTPPKHATTQIGIIVGIAVGSAAIAATCISIVCKLMRRRRRVREMTIDDDQLDTGATSTMPLLESGQDPESFISPIQEYDLPPLTSEKGGYLTHAVRLLEPQGNEMYHDLSNPFADSEGNELLPAPTRAVVGNRDALHALERRLEMRLGHLVHTLVNYGETKSNPPDYEGNSADHHSDDEDVA